MFRKLSFLSLAIVFMAFAASVVSPQTAKAAGEGKRASIPFASLGNIHDWRAWDSRTLYIKSANDTWYKATFFSPCHSLPFSDTIAFVTEPRGALDKFSSILVNGEQCSFRSFEQIDGPPKRDKDGS